MPLSVGACSAFWGTEGTECSRLHITQMVPQLKHIVYVPRETLGPWFVYHSTLFLLLGISVKCSNRPIFKLHLSNTWLLSYQLRIPVITSAMFAFWIYHFRILVRFFFISETLSRASSIHQLHSLLSIFIAVSLSTPLVSCLVALPFFFCPSPLPIPPAPSPEKLFPFLPGSNAL